MSQKLEGKIALITGGSRGIDPVFPFADDSADVEGLFECEPTLGCVPVRP